MKKIISIVGARPQFIKHAPVEVQLKKAFNSVTIHTGQHYDALMSDIFFNELNISRPDYVIDGGGGKTHGAQTGLMLAEIESICLKEKPDAVLIYGDTNSTLAGALVAAKLNIPQIHIEAGLRSYNREMPEEINRIISDEFAHLLFIPSELCRTNLAKEGISHERIFLVGDVMCDTLELVRSKAPQKVKTEYYLATIHRPYNTDDISRLTEIFNALNNLDRQVVMPIHPRTSTRMLQHGLNTENYSNIKFIEPIGYIESIGYQVHSNAVITDSGGIQKEAYMLKKKCITIRTETEWIETLINGWNELVYNDLDQKLQPAIHNAPFDHNPKLFGDGNTAKKIVDIIAKYIS